VSDEPSCVANIKPTKSWAMSTYYDIQLENLEPEVVYEFPSGKRAAVEVKVCVAVDGRVSVTIARRSK